MYKIAVIGDHNSVLGFKAVGLEAFAVSTPEQAKKTLHEKAGSDYAIIYITEGMARHMMEDIARYKDVRIPAVVPIPGMDGSFGIGMSNVKKSVERAVGSDIVFGGG